MGEPRPAVPASEFQRVKALMKELGSPSGFDPIPPDQHRWMMDPTNPPLHRMWGWMLGHTIHWGHRSAFAIDKGTGLELHIEHCAKDLGLDLSNAHRTWRAGVSRGIWRNGHPEEGPRRLYLTGKVPKFSSEVQDEKSVQTCVPLHILKQLNNLPPEQQTAIRKSLEDEIELERNVQAALVAANRAVFIERQNSILEAVGLDGESGRQIHAKKSEQPGDLGRRLQRIAPILVPIREYVQTIRDFVQSEPTVSTDANSTDASLLCSESKNQRSIPPVGRALARSRPERPQEGKKPNPNKQLPALPTKPLTNEEKQMMDLFFSTIKHLQTEPYKHMNWSREIISANRKSDELLAYRVMTAIGTEYMPQFLAKVALQLQNLDRNAFGKLPGKAPAPRSLGLILEWAMLYRESLDEAARPPAEPQWWIDRQVSVARDILNDTTETAEAKYAAEQLLKKYASKEHEAA